MIDGFTAQRASLTSIVPVVVDLLAATPSSPRANPSSLMRAAPIRVSTIDRAAYLGLRQVKR